MVPNNREAEETSSIKVVFLQFASLKKMQLIVDIFSPYRDLNCMKSNN